MTFRQNLIEIYLKDSYNIMEKNFMMILKKFKMTLIFL